MDLKKPITLIGLMGAGKTTTGMALASRLNIPFIDSDKVIEEQAGVSIAEIFKRDGEKFFRKVEAKTIEDILSRNEICVLATGGGAFINENSRRIIREKSISMWLKADLDVILDRVEQNNARPLLNDVDKRQTLEKLIVERYPVYAEADITIDTNSNSRQVVIGSILKELEAFA